jgi:predicted Fe-Mo cluster-binding NifX family protein
MLCFKYSPFSSFKSFITGGKKMKIAVSASGPGLNDRVEARFGRCPYFIFVDRETLEFDSIPNPNISLGGGAGIQSAQLMADKGVTAVLTGNCGPNAFKVFGAAGIQVITGVDGIVQDAVQRFKSNKLATSAGPNVQDHFGMNDTGNIQARTGMGGGRGMGGCGGGMGGGRGMGRGMGMGRGTGMQTSIPNQPNGFPQASQIDMPQKSELDLLKETASDIRRQLADIESKIETISGKK